MLPAQLAEMLDEPGADGMQRLFPPAYHEAGDQQRQEEYRRLMQEDLVTRHREALEVLASTAGTKHVTAEQLDAWLRAINALRLVLGTRLDVSEEDVPDEEMDVDHQVYYLLGFLQECAVEALGAGR